MLLLLLASFRQAPSPFLRLLVVGFLFVGLLDAWMTPVASSKVLRASLGTGLNRDDTNAKLLADYLDSLGHGGRWTLGNRLSLVYLIVMFGWGFIASDLPPFTSSSGGISFYFYFFGSFVVLLSVFEWLLRRLLRTARQAGYPIVKPGRG